MRNCKFLQRFICGGLLCAGIIAQCQMENWSLPSKYLNQNNQLVNLPTGDYQGEQNSYASNMAYSLNGDLKFFVQGNKIFGSNGNELLDLTTIISTAFSNSNIGTSSAGFNLCGKELVLIPSDHDCDQYFVAFSVNRMAETKHYSIGAVLNYTEEDGDPLLLAIHETCLLNPMNPDQVGNDAHQKMISYAVTTKNSGGERYLLLGTARKFFPYKLSSTGFTTIDLGGISFNIGGESVQSYSDCEAEVIPNSYTNPVNGYRYDGFLNAVPYRKQLSSTSIDGVMLYQLNSSCNPVGSPVNISQNWSDNDPLIGLELSSNAKVLYICDNDGI